MSRYKDMIGQKYGRLTVKSLSKINDHRVALWNCKCDCGKEIIVIGTSLRTGNTKSCGCIIHKHGDSNSRLYNIFKHMIWRCENPNADQYQYYGGKGISICSEWRNDFTVFKDWALSNGYENNLTIDRKKSDKNYTPENCQWITLSDNVKKRHFDNKKDGLPVGIYKRNYGGKDRFLAYSHINKITKYLGTFENVEDAVEAKQIA